MVGLTTTALTPGGTAAAAAAAALPSPPPPLPLPCDRSRDRVWMTRGSRKARVLPLPVGAAASSSLRPSSAEMACRWMGVGSANPPSARFLSSLCGASYLSCRSANDRRGAGGAAPDTRMRCDLRSTLASSKGSPVCTTGSVSLNDAGAGGLPPPLANTATSSSSEASGLAATAPRRRLLPVAAGGSSAGRGSASRRMHYE